MGRVIRVGRPRRRRGSFLRLAAAACVLVLVLPAIAHAAPIRAKPPAAPADHRSAPGEATETP